MSDEVKKIWESRRTRMGLGILGGCIVVILIFNLGMLFEAERHGFERVPPFNHGPGSFATPFGMFPLPHEFIEDGHGAVGTLTNVALPLLTLQTRTGSSETILVSTSTIIHGEATSTTLSQGEAVIVLGEPDTQGYIEAQLIRILPPMPLPPRQQ